MVIDMTMKHPSRTSEPFEFNLGQALKLRCVEQRNTICGICESCQITSHLTNTKQWYQKCGDQTRKRFVLGLVRRLHSIDLLEHFARILSPLVSKEFTYSRSRTNPGLNTDTASVSNDRALRLSQVEQNISQTWEWFSSSNYWTKSNFMLGILQLCEAHLLYAVAMLAKTLLVPEKKATVRKDDYENSSIASTSNSFHSQENEKVSLLVQTKSTYSKITKPPLTDADSDTDFEIDEQTEIVNDDSGDESVYSSLSSIDPTCMVIPTSSKAHAGVSQYKDFIRCLPVHLSKCILGMLDQVSLYSCLSVSLHWKALVKEVHDEAILKQQLWEEVMLMQGSSAQGANPIYANDLDILVPNLVPGTFDVIMDDTQEVIQTTFKSEVNFTTAYSGVSTRKVIMEERNVYCGAYNVMVVTDNPDPHRVVHTDGGKLIAVGSSDRKVRFLDSLSGKERPPLVSGHAGSVKCVYLCEERGFVLSGSYDTSIRKWSLETGKPMKIFRGHQDTICCMTVCMDKMASGAKDKCCKVWNVETAKCIRTFKHRAPVTAVALSQKFCITACEEGKVKVWNMKDGELIKRLNGHHQAVTAIKFDRWHIVTAGKEGYALVWSSQGKHNRCLNALRHPTAVLCLEFMYLRVITGSEDGRLRIWNMTTGQCCRIMRGNSRSDPILSINAIGDRITLNTQVNLLVLSFEEVEYDYTLENDKMPPMVRYSKYSDAPVRQQPYSYVRAQRMKLAGASNQKIVHHNGQETSSDPRVFRSRQIPQSAKGLSSTNVENAKIIQRPNTSKTWRSDGRVDSMMVNHERTEAYYDEHEQHYDRTMSARTGQESCGAPSMISYSTKTNPSSKPPPSPSRPIASKSQPNIPYRLTTGKSQTNIHSKLSKSTKFVEPAPSSTDEGDGGYQGQRRTSWAFDQPQIPIRRELSLSETKALLRSQLRVKDPTPPDFVYLSINALQRPRKQDEQTTRNTDMNMNERFGVQLHKRPTSSPSKIDSRTKLPVDELNLDDFRYDRDMAESVYSVESYETRTTKLSTKNKLSSQNIPKQISPSVTVAYTTQFKATPVNSTPHFSVHPKQVKSSIPKGRVIRPHTASMAQSTTISSIDLLPEKPRPASAVELKQRPGTAKSNYTSVSTMVTTASNVHKKKSHGFSTSATDVSVVPMLMYPPDMDKKLKDLKNRNRSQTTIIKSYSEPMLGRVSKHNDPMRSHADFKLRTYEQEIQRVQDMAKATKEYNKKMEEELLKKKKQAWLAKVKSKPHKDHSKRPKSVVPMMGDYNYG